MAINAGAWAIGLVAAMPSGPGPIDDARIAAIAKATKGRIKRFLLTSRTGPDDVVDHVQSCGTDVVQLVDDVPAKTYAALRQKCGGVQIVQVIHVQGPEALDQAKKAAPHCDYILLDSGRTDGPIRELGGTGRTHNWNISRQIVDILTVPVILAGGLSPDNVATACRAVSPFAVDICSGLRGPDMALDAQKLARFAAP